MDRVHQADWKLKLKAAVLALPKLNALSEVAAKLLTYCVFGNAARVTTGMLN